ncbi:Asp-tRNA(Asn)/Glu-tRNA(Gln) amidotransferase subunit GatC [Dehalococcoidia bacterium]|nr:Asp-tRNA(Asn)/Glu-tRNA(Gln) amidotransferase subunit GatC [Dehalococcoidia bacterium]MCL0056216.1 Asp-tRNA(Asn)/Glu-tRNA(Gln) amidotransferase subunit GatC [Dehalococcoidia bacterium]MCL0072811.1 Asp-tRNA(Asn)/Glu-tRNA(Gln) amidotransferase subunit GatC [Dehalococcoidia bacterium]MCL0087542.1 Asp-tRNA(Asn)/Glu-tRNA(Gln) amidotransferase subunit GatC [Dehalococcoidia bacterium]MCL0090782.1 Asp-tRNA(Asn)/Glu-tRNA(Gln) amidotransferase subunit GatC [Dehalococcoidia bacterium]
MKLDREEVEHIARLARLGLSEAEREIFQSQLSDILENFDILQELDTGDIPPTAHVIEMENVIRDDEVAPSLARDDILANAPRQENGFFRVRAVLE